MKPIQEQVIAWAQIAGMERCDCEPRCHLHTGGMGSLTALVDLAYEAGQESMKWDGIHSCHPDCQRPACVHTRKTYQEGYEAGRKDENEACAELIPPQYFELRDRIRARREQ